MLVVGIDVAAEVHQVAVNDETESVVVKPTPFAEDAAGYQKLFGATPFRWTVLGLRLNFLFAESFRS